MRHDFGTDLNQIILNDVEVIQFYFYNHSGHPTREGQYLAIGTTLGGNETASLFTDEESTEISINAGSTYYISIQIDPNYTGEDEEVVPLE